MTQTSKKLYFTVGQVIYYPSGQRVGTVERISDYLVGATRRREEMAYCRTEGGSEVTVSSTALMSETVFTREGLQRKGLSRDPNRIALPRTTTVATGTRLPLVVVVIGKGARIFEKDGELMLGVLNRINASDIEPGGFYAQTDLQRIVRPSELNKGTITLGARKHVD